jgi:hypothetical protein
MSLKLISFVFFFFFPSDISEDSVGVQIAAPPKDGKANEELLDFVSEVEKKKLLNQSCQWHMPINSVYLDLLKVLGVKKRQISLDKVCETSFPSKNP